ncbi:neurobeachin-like isoform X2 [Mercenaria mercenaria]|uniref:neurobeachin-like isoform X2 n=1 Tax=Mercenaria mercenaria TaxID=6596 RepID=UPI00234EA60A|nr:neurobeachin-like isoform X2 [Mercenaria mercenaria]
MSEEGQSAESDVKTVAEILKSEGNDELKFGLLISLIKVNQATSKDVVNTVLHLLVGGEFEIETNFVIQDPQNILQMLTVVEQCPENLQAEIWSVFLAMMKKSRRNLQACTEVGLISRVMDLLLKAGEVVADLLIDMLGALAAYSITVKELRQLFRYLKADDGTWPRHSVKLISVLKQMPQRQGPDEFFSFPGKKGSCIHVPPVKTWPYQSGWTFSCWLRLDPVTGVTVERERPYLFCFHTNKGVGYSANFLGNSLVITSMKVKGKGFQHCVKYEFQPRKWYMVSIVHVYNRWSKSEIRCYVDGQLASGTDMSWLVSTYDPFDKCYIGGSSEGDVDHMFSGQLSALYLFSEALSPQQISSIHELGPSYKSQFRFPNESQVRLSETAHRLLYDGKLTSIIVFMYNPIACDGQLCLESSPKGNFNHFQHSPHAMMSGEVKSVITHSIHSTLHSLGGVQILFPLFGQLDLPVAQGEGKSSATDHSTCANLLGLLYNLIESSSTIHQQMVQNKGFLVIGHLLEKSSRDHVTPSVLEVFLKLTDYLVKCPAGGTLLKHLFDHILFNPAIWIHSCMEVQTKLYCYLATDFINDAQIYNNIRRVSAVLQTMHTLKYYYWVVNPKDRSGITPKAVDGPRPDYDEIIKLRSFMLLYIKQLLLKGQGVQEDELQSMLNYLCTLHEDDNLVDVLELLVTLMSEHPQSMVPAFDKKQGVRTVFKLLASPNEDIRIKTLKLFGFWLSRSTPKRKQDSLSQHNLFSLLGERLLLNDQHITIATYNALFEMLTERISLESHKGKHEEPESHFRIENSALLKVVATMIRQSKPSPEILEVKRVFLSDLTILCKNNKENRRTVLQMSVWQDWLFSMAYVYPQNQEQHKVTEMVMALFRMLLHHAIKFEYGGWRVWIDTLAILHSKVAYEDFKRHMAKMYKQYDRQRVDDYADHEERNRQPISTISGVSDSELNKPIPKSTVKVTEIEDSETAGAEKPLDNENEASSKTDQSESDKTVNGDIGVGNSKNGENDAAEHQRDRQKMPTRTDSTRSGHRMFSSGPRAPPFRIPEFRWSYLHQQLLKDLLFSIETDVQVWKSHTTKTVIDFVNSSENNIYVVNVTHMISQLADNLITSCGGLLPLLAAATSSNGEVEILEPTQGLSIEQAVSILLRIMNLTDILVFASSTTFAELEQEKNMPAGGILRQCLRLVCTAAVRNSLEVRHRQVPPTPPTPTSTAHPLASHSRDTSNQNGTTDPIQALIEGSHPTRKNIVENLNEQMSPIKDFDKLLQDMDINRLRAVVYRDVEETKQAQFLALAIVYFTSVLMVSKYRDILEPPSPAQTPSQMPRRSSNHAPSGNQSEDEESEKQPGQGDSQVQDGTEQVVDESQEKLKIPVDVHVNMDTSLESGATTEDSEAASPARPVTEGGGENEGAKGSGDGVEEEEEEDSGEEEDEEEGEEDKTEGKPEEKTEEKSTEEPEGKEEIGAGDNEETEQNATTDEKKDSEPTETVEEKDKEEDVSATDDDKDTESEIKEEQKSEEAEEVKTETEGAESAVDDQEKSESSEPVEDSDKTTDESKATEDSVPATVDTNETAGDENKAEVNGRHSPVDSLEASVEATDQILSVQLPSEGDQSQVPITSISAGTRKPSESSEHQKPEKLELKSTPIPGPVSLSMLDSGNLTERLEKALGSVAPLLREIFVDFAPYLSKTLIGSHGQELLIGGLVTLKQSTSVVELVMLLCSQEWQNSLQKHAGLAFIELVNEGRLLAHATRDHIVRVANEADFILNRMRAEDVQRHAEFESLCAQMMLDRREEEKLCDHLITSAKRRDYSVAMKLRDKVLNILANKHGAWGEPDKQKNEYWKLDVWEDDSRRRRRFIKNAIGSTHPDAALKAALEHGATEDAINQAREAFHAHLDSKKAQALQPDYTDEELLMEDTEFEREYSGPVAMSTTCKLIAPGVAINGLMSITKTDLYYEMDEDDAENKKIDSEVLAYIDYLHGKWNFNEIRAIFSRRYLLQNVAIEIFLANRTAIMFSFPDHATVKKVINALPRVGVGVKYGLGQSRRMSSASGKQLYKMSAMTQKWQRREISNFDYLMYLNTIAGRTYNDLNQYPVFPWVIVNYDSDELDLSQPNNFRDLSKPIGALNPSRKEFFEDRYNSWEHDQIPPFHYGTHYSTSAFTLNWLIRVEPFTTMFLNLQGGKFDHADRTFHSVSQAWKNCQRDTSDVKELIPEFFALPEMFMNTNKFNLGKQDDGTEVNSVVLPKWAKSPEDFVRINRMALESEFVSCQLHHWIDLIFGYKQRGPEAVRATNVFYYLTYEGSVNLETMTDHVMKEAIENQIRSFGQTPTQLLTEPHPPRSSVMHLLTQNYSKENRSILKKSPMMFTSVQDDVCMIMKFLSNSPVCHVSANTHPAVPNPAVTAITCNHNFSLNKWNPNYQHQGTPTSLGSAENKDTKDAQPNLPLAMDQLLVMNTGLQRRSLGDNFDQRLKVSQSHFVTTADNRFIFACGFWDKSFRLYLADTAKILQVVYGHFDVVTCITRSECNLNQDCYIVTGSKDCTVMVWMFTSRNQAIIGDNGSIDHPTPKATLTGHKSEVTSVSVLAELGMVISGSHDGPCLVHTLNGDLLRSLDPPEGKQLTANLICMSRETFVMIRFDQNLICNFSINGRLQKHIKHKDNIQAMTLSRDGQYLMLGGDNGVVEVYRSHDLTLLYSYPACDSCICSLALSHDHKFLLAGLATGCLLVFNIDFNKWHHEYQEKY